ncbi:unnamed protein product [Rotaria sordida]|uniref:Uncharacterized protein n=1 Tax=Rotaria sordida TaxID=392033 RepID=A0A814UT50_9BILA|nr:unnamed protein product [Rotaria sordida]CAF1179237.1 unnamed protein product [Rotaria sordida]
MNNLLAKIRKGFDLKRSVATKFSPSYTKLLFNNLLSANIGIDSINGTFARIRCGSLDSIDKGYQYS